MKLKLTWLLTLFMAFVMQFSFAQEKTITGTITSSEDGLPLPGANVVVKNTTRGAQADFDGNYSIKASEGEILVFTFSGMDSTEKTVGAGNTIDVALKTNALDEIVIIGYSSTIKSKSTAAVSVVTSEDVENIPLATFEQMLQGRVPGLDVSSGSGQPGTVANVRIRGVNSLNGNTQPLYIVDGIQIDPASFGSLNANDFETFSVLKDAQAKSIYGSRAAAGVIVITTKQGKSGKTQIKFRTYTGWSEAPDPEVRPLSAREFVELSREFGANGFGSITNPEIDALIAGLNGFNISDALLRTGLTNNYELSFSGGDDRTTFFLSAGYFEQEGTVKGSELQRMTTRMNFTHKATDKLTIALNTSLGFKRLDQLPSNGGVNLANPFLAPQIGNPITPVFNADGSFNTGGGLAFALPNILEEVETGINDNEEFKLIASARVDYQFTDQISATYNIGVDFEDDFSVFARDPNSFRGQTISALGTAGSHRETNTRDVNFTSTLKVQYQNVFADKHSLTVAAFLEAVRRDFRSDTFTGFGLDPDVFGFTNAITAGTIANGLIPTVGGTRFISGLFSIFGTASYDYDSRYGLDVTVRQDESSRVAPANSDEVFYSVGGRWNIDKEAFMDNVDWVNALKIRASYGTSGNDLSVGVNAAIQQLSNTPLFQGSPVLVRAALANANVQWEITEDFNLGLDFGLFNNKVNGTFDYYKSVTDQLIIPFNISAAFGSTVLNNVNAGELENEGVELGITYNIVNTEDWRFSINANGAYNFGRVTDLGGQVTEFQSGTFITRVGEQINSQFVVPFVGVNPANGDPLYLDLNGNVTNVFNNADARTGFGSSVPLYTGGFGFDLGWKGFNLNVLFSYQAEVTRFNNTSFFSENLNFLSAGLNQASTVLRRWQQPGDITDVPRYTAQRQFSSADLEDASFLRLRNVNISYTVPQKFLDNTAISSVRIYGTGVNLLTFTEFTGLDPEDNNNISSFEFPNARTFTLGVDIGF